MEEEQRNVPVSPQATPSVPFASSTTKSWLGRLTSTTITFSPSKILNKLAPTVLAAAPQEKKVEDGKDEASTPVLSIQEVSPVSQPAEEKVGEPVASESLRDKFKKRVGDLFQKKPEEEKPIVREVVIEEHVQEPVSDVKPSIVATVQAKLDEFSEKADVVVDKVNAALDVVLPGGKILAEQQRLAEERAAAVAAQQKEAEDSEAAEARAAAAIVLDISTPEPEEKSEGRLARGVKAVSEFLSRKKSKEEKEYKDKEETEGKMAAAAQQAEVKGSTSIPDLHGSFVIRDQRSVVDHVVTGVKKIVTGVASVFSKKEIAEDAASDSLRESLINTNIAESADQLEQRKKLIDDDIIQLAGFINNAVTEIDAYLRDVKIRKLTSISDGVWTGPSRSTKNHILKAYISFTNYSGDDGDEKALVKERAIENAAERWWTSGPLKLLRYVSSSYKEAYDKLMNGTRDFFETSIVADELYSDVNALQGGREKFQLNFARYQTYLNLKGDDEVEYINERRFGTIFDKREKIIELGHKVVDIEEVLFLNRQIKESEDRLNGDLGEKEVDRVYLEECLNSLIKKRADVVAQITDKQMILVSLPESTYKPEGKPRPPIKMTADESLRQTFGELEEVMAESFVAADASLTRLEM